jgi:hypothetical protein
MLLFLLLCYDDLGVCDIAAVTVGVLMGSEGSLLQIFTFGQFAVIWVILRVIRLLIE